MSWTKSTQSDALTGGWIPPLSRCSRGARQFALLLGLTLVCSGCSLTQGLNNAIAYNDPCNDFVMGWRNSVWASQAWHNQKQYFAGHAELRAFGAGFRDGYQSVASGGNGCPPPLPPRQYWSWKYQTAEGQCKVAAWFEGYGYGAAAAEQDGAGNFQNIQVSHAIETQYSPEFQSGQIPAFGPGEYILPGEPVEPAPYQPLPEAAPLAPPTIGEGPGITPASWTAPSPATAWPRPTTPPMASPMSRTPR